MRYSHAACLLASLLPIIGCSGSSGGATTYLPSTPSSVRTAGTPSPVPYDGFPFPEGTNARGNATVLSVSGPCPVGPTVGETITSEWNDRITATSAYLDENVNLYPDEDTRFTAEVDDHQFTATAPGAISTNPDNFRCRFLGATLRGTFFADFSSFDAVEVDTWGSGADETTVQKQWHVTKM